MVAEVSLTDLLIEALAAEVNWPGEWFGGGGKDAWPDDWVDSQGHMIDWPETDLVERLTDPIIKGVDGEVRLTTLMIRVGCGGSKVDWPDDWVASQGDKVD